MVPVAVDLAEASPEEAFSDLEKSDALWCEVKEGENALGDTEPIEDDDEDENDIGCAGRGVGSPASRPST